MVAPKPPLPTDIAAFISGPTVGIPASAQPADAPPAPKAPKRAPRPSAASKPAPAPAPPPAGDIENQIKKLVQVRMPLSLKRRLERVVDAMTGRPSEQKVLLSYIERGVAAHEAELFGEKG